MLHIANLFTIYQTMERQKIEEKVIFKCKSIKNNQNKDYHSYRIHYREHMPTKLNKIISEVHQKIIN